MSRDSTSDIVEIAAYKDSILYNLSKIEEILKSKYPDQYHIAYQHWIPQIVTAIQEDSRWLNRGQYSIDYTIRTITDNTEDNHSQKGVIKFVK